MPKVNTTEDLKKNPVDFHVLGSITDEDTGAWVANGVYVNDDGEQVDVTGNYNQYQFTVRRSFASQ